MYIITDMIDMIDMIDSTHCVTQNILGGVPP